ncbi:transcriptional regulator [Methylorubrum rhodesianum]|uniref:helix-turn-helix domain-containing protein n=1 Tax=Methylorubrum rhodesianum TaxID=29427 RepID=UPI003D2662AF
MSSSSAPVRAVDPPRLVTDDDVRARLRQAVARAGTQRAAAAALGLDPAVVSAVLGGRRAPTGAVCRAVGVERRLVAVGEGL